MDATMYAVRLARFVTGRPVIVRFEGHGHGMTDATLAGGVRPPAPDVPDNRPLPVEAVFRGLIPDSEKPVIILPWNDPEVLERTLRERGHDIAAAIMEPVNMSMGVVWPASGYLEKVRALTQELGIVLIFDEILCGFRTGPGCMQKELGVRPDLTTLGKALGGGVSVSCLGGSRQLMQHLRPVGECPHSGTFFGHGVALAAALAFLNQIGEPNFYPRLEELEGYFYPRLQDVFVRHNLAVRVVTAGSQFGLFFTKQEAINNWRACLRCDHDMALRYYRHLLQCGVYVNPPAIHHSLCAALTKSDLDELLNRMDTAAARLKQETA
jgi:glutamate-1-semialdehyde 2,1-aminomutase